MHLTISTSSLIIIYNIKFASSKTSRSNINNSSINLISLNSHITTCQRAIYTQQAISVPVARTTQSSKIHSYILGRQERLQLSPSSIAHHISENNYTTENTQSSNPHIIIEALNTTGKIIEEVLKTSINIKQELLKIAE